MNTEHIICNDNVIDNPLKFKILYCTAQERTNPSSEKQDGLPQDSH